MSNLKTVKNRASVRAFLESVADAERRRDCAPGKHKTGKSCLYIKKLEDVDQEVLRALIRTSVQDMREKYH